MTESEAIDLDKLIADAKALSQEKDTLARTFRGFRDYGNPKSTITSSAEKAQKEAEQYEYVAKLFEEIQQYRAIGTVEEFQEAKTQFDNINSAATSISLAYMCKFDAAKESIISTIKDLKDKSKFDELKLVRNKAIDEFAEALRLECIKDVYCDVHMIEVFKIAEQLKGGAV